MNQCAADFFVCADIYKKGSLRPDSTEEAHMFLDIQSKTGLQKNLHKEKIKVCRKVFLMKKKYNDRIMET